MYMAKEYSGEMLINRETRVVQKAETIKCSSDSWEITCVVHSQSPGNVVLEGIKLIKISFTEESILSPNYGAMDNSNIYGYWIILALA